MDFLNKQNMTYIIILLFILLAMIHLFNMKESGIESFITLIEDQNFSPEIKTNIPSTDLVQFSGIGSSTEPNNLTTILNSKLGINTNNTLEVPNIRASKINMGFNERNTINCPEPMFISTTGDLTLESSTKVNISSNLNFTKTHNTINVKDWGLLQGGRVHLNSTVDDIYLISKGTTHILKNAEWGSSGTLNVGGDIWSAGNISTGSPFYSTMSRNEGGQLSLLNPIKTNIAGLADNWTLFNMTDRIADKWKYPNGLNFYKYGKDLTTTPAQFILLDTGSSIFNGPLSVSAKMKHQDEINRWHTNDGTGTFIVRCDSVEPSQGSLRIETAEWGGGSKPSFSTINCKGRLHIYSDESALLITKGSTIIHKRDDIGATGNLVVQGTLNVGGGIWSAGGVSATNGLSMTGSGNGGVGGAISIINTDKTGATEAYIWNIYNMRNYGRDHTGGPGKPGSGLSFWRYAKDNACAGNLCDRHMTLNDDGSSFFGGSVGASSFPQNSDKRLKENIKTISQNDKDKVLQLVPKTYNMINDENKIKRYGLIAQEVEELYPELVTTNSTDGMKLMNYVELIPLLLEQIKELKKSIPNPNLVNTNVLNIGGVTLTANELLKLKQLLN